LSSPSDPSYRAVYRNHQVILEDSIEWPEGTKLEVSALLPGSDSFTELNGHAIIVGFGLAGRYVADLVEQAKMRCVVIERNPVTVKTQVQLGREIILGDGTDTASLTEAGLQRAAILALTVPDEEAVLKATTLARRLRPDIYIIARTNYASQGMRASQLGADEVVKAEQAVAIQFYMKLSQHLHRLIEKSHDASEQRIARVRQESASGA